MSWFAVFKIFVVLFTFLNVAAADDDLFPLSIIHINDFHARYEQTDTTGGDCEAGEVCVGGYARTVYTVRKLLREQKDYNPVYFNAGDSFQGTLWYNIGRWNVTSQFLNILPADAMTLGNHEFDHGVEGVVPFLEALNTTMLVANMNSTFEPTLNGKYQNSMIIEKSNRKIGVIGVILETTYDLANTGKLIFRNESDTIREEAEKLKAQGANIIIVISHCGYDVDQLIAKHAGADIDVIVGAHSHTFLYTGDVLPGPDKPRGPYPTEVIHESGHRVLIVQASAYARYVGNLTVFFDDKGDVIRHEGQPIYMNADVPEDSEVLQMKAAWRDTIETGGSVVYGETKVDLLNTYCGSKECNVGNFYCDAIFQTFLELVPYNATGWSNVSIALASNNDLHISIPRGNITYGQLFSLCPYENNLIAFNLSGQHLIEALEYGVSLIDLSNNVTTTNNFLQFSGLKVRFNLTAPSGQRVVGVRVRCASCSVPKYVSLKMNKSYRIIAPSYIAGGGWGFTMLKEFGTDRLEYKTELEALMDYVTSVKPITTGIEGRIRLL
ncbi:apyrase isoform X2 [Teleopsis dalmanni]|uniref:apyrase isoform X2 n=1 Tax=Teleopsis dalmanni TaxID=139649 RepID=UPI0018CE30A8|nr:apyrase isoform X2 [Teleopsis dalmanni]